VRGPQNLTGEYLKVALSYAVLLFVWQIKARSHLVLKTVILNGVMLSVAFSCYPGCHNAECSDAECRDAECLSFLLLCWMS
jgi:hypothetical protein